jgi:hypothetical protein
VEVHQLMAVMVLVLLQHKEAMELPILELVVEVVAQLTGLTTAVLAL